MSWCAVLDLFFNSRTARCRPYQRFADQIPKQDQSDNIRVRVRIFLGQLVSIQLCGCLDFGEMNDSLAAIQELWEKYGVNLNKTRVNDVCVPMLFVARVGRLRMLGGKPRYELLSITCLRTEQTLRAMRNLHRQSRNKH